MVDLGTVLTISIGLTAGLIGWLLNKRDDKQAEEMRKHDSSIELLFKEHKEDVAELNNLKLKLAEHHYPKPEMDAKFADLNAAIKEGFGQLNESMKEISKSFSEHLKDHPTSKERTQCDHLQ